MNWIVITTAAILFIGFIVGLYRGAIRIAVSLVTTIVTLALVGFLTPYVVDAITKFTPLDDAMTNKVSEAMVDAATSQISGGVSETVQLSEDDVRRVLNAAGASEEELLASGITIQDIVNGTVTGDQLAKLGISSSILDGLEARQHVEDALQSDVEIPRDIQMAAIEQAQLPEVFKVLLTNNNNNEIYQELGVETFAQYVGSFLSKLMIHAVAFLCTFLLVTVILRAVIFALDIVSELPVLGVVNRLAGGAIGLVCALIIIWLMFVVITLLYTTSFGREAYDVIQAHKTLSVIYEYNPIMRLATNI